MKKTTLLLLLFFTLFITNSQAQKLMTIEGKVVEKSNNNQGIVGVNVTIKGTKKGTISDFDGSFNIKIDSTDLPITLVFKFIGYVTEEVVIKNDKFLTVKLQENIESLDEVIVIGYGKSKRSRKKALTGAVAGVKVEGFRPVQKSAKKKDRDVIENDESYASVKENDFLSVQKNPLSTFSVDVDRAAYSNIRRHLNNGNLPSTDAVRIEEMINYFDYDYPQPKEDVPFSVNHELSNCPWNEDNLLLKIGLQGKKMDTDKLPPSNIVFLLDVSGSMSDQNKLPLLKSSLKMLLNNMDDKDRVAIVVYAGSSGLRLESTSCDNKMKIIDALESLSAGGSTAGGKGLKLAYKVAEENFLEDGNNRIILATDGDFNVGIQNPNKMKDLIEEKRDKGINISVLGFGMGNYKDDMMEIIADKGNGNYAYIDNLQEAHKVLVKEFGGTFYTIAKDVKFQVEFNPKFVKKYRLIGYENRMLADEDFKDDKKDAGDIGAGHSVTALYEIIPSKGKQKSSSDLKYQTSELTDYAKKSNDIITLKLRYKKPKERKSKLIEVIVKNNVIPLTSTSTDFKFTASIAEFGMLLKDSKYKGTSTYESVIELATDGKGKDIDGYRGEMIRLVKLGKSLDSNI